MTDMKAWIEERRAIHAAAESPWWTTRDLQPATVFAGDGSAEDIAVLTTFEHIDAAAIVDAHNMFPRALDALSAVLELHKPVHQVFSWQAGGTIAHEPCETCHGKAGKPGDHECGCWGDRDLVYTCAECRDDKGRDIDWPCATAQVIEGAINNE